MSYVTFTEIASEFKNLTFGVSGAVTSDEVVEFIEQEEALVNASVSVRYEVPVVGVESIKILKRIVSSFVAYRVAKILNLKKDVTIPEKFVAQVLNEGSFYALASKQLESIRIGTLILPDAVTISTGQGVSSYNAINNVEPLWERDKKQW